MIYHRGLTVDFREIFNSHPCHLFLFAPPNISFRFDLMMIPTIKRMISEKPMITVEIALISGVKPNLIDVCISIGSVVTPLGIRK